MAIAAAAKLPTCLTSAAALPVADAPPAVLEAEPPEAFEVWVAEEPVVLAVPVADEVPVAV